MNEREKPRDARVSQPNPAVSHGRDAASDVRRESTAMAEAPSRHPRDDHDRDGHTALFDTGEGRGLRDRWEAIQTGFVDEPRAAVEQADQLVSQVLGRLTEVFSRERMLLEQQWTRGGDVSTEDLRVALKRYRSFFERLLSV
jgi:hypothetical protein